jgi:hypothetical protein
MCFQPLLAPFAAAAPLVVVALMSSSSRLEIVVLQFFVDVVDVAGMMHVGGLAANHRGGRAVTSITMMSMMFTPASSQEATAASATAGNGRGRLRASHHAGAITMFAITAGGARNVLRSGVLQKRRN